MALFVVATPIGNAGDFTERALQTLRKADLIIGEELKVLRQTLKAAGVQAERLEQLNEHTREADLDFFVEEAKNKNVALVSDCGTPGFCDPGADLVAACVQNNVEVKAVPGVSSLMTLLSVAGKRVDRFLFYGFLSAKTELRNQAIKNLKTEKSAFIILETPYRFEKWFEELKTNFPNHHCVLGLNLTAENEKVLRGKTSQLKPPAGAHEPIALLIPS